MKKVVTLNEADLRSIISEALCHVLQEGSRYSYDDEQKQFQNLTFQQLSDGNWKYLGLCFAGQTKPVNVR